MKVAAIFLTLNRLELTKQVMAQNFYNSEVNAPVYWIDNGSDPEFMAGIPPYPWKGVHHFENNKGIATAINKGIELAFADDNYDAVVTLANDILMPRGWLRALIEHAERIPENGLSSIHFIHPPVPITARGVHEDSTPISNVFINRRVIETIGGYNTDLDPYGAIDVEYAFRLADAGGFVNYYVPGMISEHIGHDAGTDTPYRQMKDAGLARTTEVANAAFQRYRELKSYYVPFK